MDELPRCPGSVEMALLVMKCAFDIVVGVSVDTHVHRIATSSMDRRRADDG